MAARLQELPTAIGWQVQRLHTDKAWKGVNGMFCSHSGLGAMQRGAIAVHLLPVVNRPENRPAIFEKLEEVSYNEVAPCSLF